jgi:hypothetical protein
MTGQPWLAWSFAALMLMTAAYCLVRLLISGRLHRPADRFADSVHVLMGAAMAGMLVPQLRLPWAGGLEATFAATAAWFGWLAVRGHRAAQAGAGRAWLHHLQHAFASAAMVYMLASLPATTPAAARGSVMVAQAAGAVQLRTLALALALVLVGYVVWTADGLSALPSVAVLSARAVQVLALAGTDGPAGAPATAKRRGGSMASRDPGRDRPGSGVPMSPRLAACCEMAMGVTMAYMLIQMI